MRMDISGAPWLGRRFRGMMMRRAGVPTATRARILELEEVMRRTSICGLGQVALGPVVSVLGFNKGGAMAAEQAQSTKPTS